MSRSKAERHARDSHTHLDPFEMWKRAMRIAGITKEAWDNLQCAHFTYWYMPRGRGR